MNALLQYWQSWMVEASILLPVLTLFALAGDRLLPRAVHLVYGLWLLVFCRAIVPSALLPVWTVASWFPVTTRVQGVKPVTDFSHLAWIPEVGLKTGFSSESFSFIVWITGMLGALLFFVVAEYRVRHLARRERAFLAQPILEELDRCKRSLGIFRNVGVSETGLVRVPTLMGFISPLVLLPKGFSSRFSLEETRLCFLHELQHLRRYDTLVNWFVTLSLSVFWFHPFAWIAWVQLRAAQERACDASVLNSLEHPDQASYANLFVSLANDLVHSQSLPGFAGLASSHGRFFRRFSLIANFRRPGALRRLLSTGSLVLVGLVTMTHAWSADSSDPPSETEGSSALESKTSASESTGRWFLSVTCQSDPDATTPPDGCVRCIARARNLGATECESSSDPTGESCSEVDSYCITKMKCRIFRCK